MDAEYWRLTTFAELGGTPAPSTINWAMGELVLGANPAVFMFGSGAGFAAILHRNGTPDQQRFAELAIERQWGGTMVLTEPEAGSDVGAARATARQQPDGTWHLEGVKRFITSAEWDWPENIFHLVLARPVGVAGAGGPGTKGLSLFLVSKHHVDLATGEATVAHHQRSDVCAVPAAGIVAEAMVALVLAEAVLEKFGGDSVMETRRNAESYLDTLRFK